MPNVRKPARRSPNLIDRRGAARGQAARARNQRDVAAGRSGGPGTVPATYYAQDAIKVPLIGRQSIGRATAGLAKAPANPNRSRITTTGSRSSAGQHPLTTAVVDKVVRGGRGRGSRRRG